MQKSTSCDEDEDAGCNVFDHVGSISSSAFQPSTTDDHADISENGDEEVTDEQGDQVPELLANVDQPTVALPPDGGWGWLVVAAAFVANLVVDGVAYTFGIIMPELVDHFEAGKGKTALVGSLIPGVYLTVGRNIFSLHWKKQYISRAYSILHALC